MKKSIVMWVLSVSLSVTAFTGCGKEEASGDQVSRAGERTKKDVAATEKRKTEVQEKQAAEKQQKTEKKTEEKGDGWFHGSYEGNDGCRYEFLENGTLKITFDGVFSEYQYTLQENILTIMEDGTEVERMEVTLLEEGTYLLEDDKGTQIVLAYQE